MILNRGNLFSFLVTIFVGAIFLLMVFETWALFTGNKPISDYFREMVHAFPGWALVIAILAGITIGHFLWGPATGPLSPAPRRLGALRRSGAAN
jgi:NADH:ubiquinone oxidoreductase subunit 6 (subunit J)